MGMGPLLPSASECATTCDPKRKCVEYQNKHDEILAQEKNRGPRFGFPQCVWRESVLKYIKKMLMMRVGSRSLPFFSYSLSLPQIPLISRRKQASIWL